MNLFNFFKRQGTAPVARDRLQILLAYERGSTRGAPDLLAILREEILTAVGRHVQIDSNRVNVRVDRGEKVSTLEVDIEIPNAVRMAPRRKRAVPMRRSASDRVALPCGSAAASPQFGSFHIFAAVLSCPDLPPATVTLVRIWGSFPVRRRTPRSHSALSPELSNARSRRRAVPGPLPGLIFGGPIAAPCASASIDPTSAHFCCQSLSTPGGNSLAGAHAPTGFRPH
jgi:cell division topological specificity factor